MAIDVVDAARRYLAYYAMQARGDSELEESFGDWLRVQDVIDDDPDLGLILLKSLVALSPDDGALQFVAAGPLEDYVCRYGTRLPVIIACADQDERFARALAGIWGENRVSDEARSQLAEWRDGHSPAPPGTAPPSRRILR